MRYGNLRRSTVVTIAPQVKAKDDETAVGAAIIAILGTIFTLIYTLLYPVLGLSPYGYGVFSGATLHEIAHVIAAAAPGGSTAVDIAVIVKLTRRSNACTSSDFNWSMVW